MFGLKPRLWKLSLSTKSGLASLVLPSGVWITRRSLFMCNLKSSTLSFFLFIYLNSRPHIFNDTVYEMLFAPLCFFLLVDSRSFTLHKSIFPLFLQVNPGTFHFMVHQGLICEPVNTRPSLNDVLIELLCENQVFFKHAQKV